MIGQTEIESVKRKNIIEMALGFTAMMRLFSVGSKEKIEAQLDRLFSNLAETRTRDDYKVRHHAFCGWFVREIRTAEKRLKNGQVQSSQPASYGQAAKVLDIAIKVYVYYCAQPTAEVAQRIVPFLNGAIDGPIMGHLKTSRYVTSPIRATTIKEIDEDAYRALQEIVRKESLDQGPHPVQYEDVMWRRLNRERS